MTQMTTLDPRLKPAEPQEIAEALRLLCSSLRAPDGSDTDMMLAAYGVALSGYPTWAIANAARKFVRGEIEGQSLAFCPRPPELGAAVRKEMEWVYREIERERRTARIARENAEFRREVRRTPAEKQRAAELYRQFCEQHKSARSPGIAQDRVQLDPALVAQIDDAPTTWERLNWTLRGGRHGRT